MARYGSSGQVAGEIGPTPLSVFPFLPRRGSCPLLDWPLGWFSGHSLCMRTLLAPFLPRWPSALLACVGSALVGSSGSGRFGGFACRFRAGCPGLPGHFRSVSLRALLAGSQAPDLGAPCRLDPLASGPRGKSSAAHLWRVLGRSHTTWGFVRVSSARHQLVRSDCFMPVSGLSDFGLFAPLPSGLGRLSGFAWSRFLAVSLASWRGFSLALFPRCFGTRGSLL